MVNIPIIADTLALRVVGGYRHRAGFIDDVVRGEKNYNTDDTTTIRAVLRWTPSPSTTVDLSGSYQNLSYVGFPQAIVGTAFGPYDGGTPYRENGKQPVYLAGLTVKEREGGR